jgi:RHS repeat-associated protein
LTPQQWGQAWPTHLGPNEWLNPPGSRLTHVGDNDLAVPQTHFFDANGNLVRENTERHFEWDHTDRLRAFRIQTGNAAPSVQADYLYDSAGERIKKRARKQSGRIEVTVYINGSFEHHRIEQADSTLENNTLHVMDNQKRVALVRIGKAFSGDGSPAIKHHLSDHLGSCSLVLDGTGAWVNHEEYTPYGETSFGSFATKHYRFTGKERDEESGLTYHGARYYAPWLTRWISCDPLGLKEGSNVYAYVKATPLRLIDSRGEEAGLPGNESPTYREQSAGMSSVELHAPGCESKTPQSVSGAPPEPGLLIEKGLRLTGGYGFWGLAGPEGKHLEAELLGMVGYDAKKGFYDAYLAGYGARGWDLTAMAATESAHYWRSGEREEEELFLGEAELKHSGFGFFVNQKHPEQIGLYGFLHAGPAVGGVGLTLHSDNFAAYVRQQMADMQESLARSGINLVQVPKGTPTIKMEDAFSGAVLIEKLVGASYVRKVTADMQESLARSGINLVQVPEGTPTINLQDLQDAFEDAVLIPKLLGYFGIDLKRWTNDSKPK